MVMDLSKVTHIKPPLTYIKVEPNVLNMDVSDTWAKV
jgi:hypothetical protein